MRNKNQICLLQKYYIQYIILTKLTSISVFEESYQKTLSVLEAAWKLLQELPHAVQEQGEGWC